MGHLNKGVSDRIFENEISVQEGSLKPSLSEGKGDFFLGSVGSLYFPLPNQVPATGREALSRQEGYNRQKWLKVSPLPFRRPMSGDSTREKRGQLTFLNGSETSRSFPGIAANHIKTLLGRLKQENFRLMRSVQ